MCPRHPLHRSTRMLWRRSWPLLRQRQKIQRSFWDRSILLCLRSKNSSARDAKRFFTLDRARSMESSRPLFAGWHQLRSWKSNSEMAPFGWTTRHITETSGANLKNGRPEPQFLLRQIGSRRGYHPFSPRLQPSCIKSRTCVNNQQGGKHEQALRNGDRSGPLYGLRGLHGGL